MIHLLTVIFALIGVIGLFLIITIGLWQKTDDWRYARMGCSRWSRFWITYVRKMKLEQWEDSPQWHRSMPYREDMRKLQIKRNKSFWDRARLTLYYWFGR